MRKIIVVTGTRADYGIYLPILNALEEAKDFEVSLLVTGMHLSQRHGKTIDRIREDGFKIAGTVYNLLQDSTNANMAKSIGLGILGMVQIFEEQNPDYVMILGDRGEMLAAAIAAAHMNIPTLHLHGGEVSGTIDESVRHAITKLSHFHFPATKNSQERLIKMGEDPWRIKVSGAPRIETIMKSNSPLLNEVLGKYNLNIQGEYYLLIYHPVTTELDLIANEITSILEVLLEEKKDIICVLPNSDAGNEEIINIYNEFNDNSYIHFVTNFGPMDYLTVLKHCKALIGNSSSGIIEAASYKTPVINIGTRQCGRERSDNVIDSVAQSGDIKEALKQLETEDFQKKLENTINIYGQGNTSQVILDTIRTIENNKKLIQKNITY